MLALDDAALARIVIGASRVAAAQQRGLDGRAPGAKHFRNGLPVECCSSRFRRLLNQRRPCGQHF
jgi:hypothetical protein